MPDRDAPERCLEGVVVAQLPSGLYQVRLRDADGRVTAHVGEGRGKNFVRLVVGDRVTVELSPKDLGRGRIVRKV